MRSPLFCLLFFLASAAQAEVPAARFAETPDARLKADWEQRFRAADRDRSRSLDAAEAEAGLPKALWRHFAEIDTNRDGGLTPEELWAMHEREVAARTARRAARVQSGPPR